MSYQSLFQETVACSRQDFYNRLHFCLQPREACPDMPKYLQPQDNYYDMTLDELTLKWLEVMPDEVFHSD